MLLEPFTDDHFNLLTAFAVALRERKLKFQDVPLFALN